jgi:thiol:disulfide interchange protein DsbD
MINTNKYHEPSIVTNVRLSDTQLTLANYTFNMTQQNTSISAPPTYIAIRYLLLALTLCFAHTSLAIDTATTNNPFTPQEETFLPVDEAYQLQLHQTDTHIIAEWMIADKYFLYGEQFRFSVNGETVTATRKPGKISYDEIFERDVEKYYVYVKASIDKSQLNSTQGLTQESPQESPQETTQLSITSQGCADAGLCYPPETKLYSITPSHISLNEPQSPNTLTTPYEARNTATSTPPTPLIIMLTFAVIGGALLNLMPCVFPVLSIKALSLIKHTDQRSRILHGWSYTAGCLLTFVIIAGILLAIRQAGTAVGWGFQLQEPAIITFLSFLFFIMGLSLSGLVAFGTRYMGVGQSLTQGKELSHSFFTGVLASVVASPCTAPFMASALGYALTQTNSIALSIFAAIGFGMALPFLLLSYSPQLSRLLPQPGAWMDTFKQALAFPLYITSAWLLWVLGHQIGNDAVILVLLGAITITFALWLKQKKPTWTPAIYIASMICIAFIIWSNKQSANENTPKNHSTYWQPYTAKALANLRKSNSAVFINLTADWCITCKINEKRVFTPATLQTMKDKGIHLLEGDWTQHNPEITELLNQYHRGGVPLYLLFPANKEAKAKILPQLLNPSEFNATIEAI